MSLASKQKLKQVVFSTILYTDMSFHNQLCSDFMAIDFKSTNQKNISNNHLKVTAQNEELIEDLDGLLGPRK